MKPLKVTPEVLEATAGIEAERELKAVEASA